MFLVLSTKLSLLIKFQCREQEIKKEVYTIDRRENIEQIRYQKLIYTFCSVFT
jgi:hypothetical protein